MRVKKMKIPDAEIVKGSNEMIDDYMVEFGSSPEALRKRVLSLNAEGWCLQGGVSFVCGGSGRMSYAQALVKARPFVRCAS